MSLYYFSVGNNVELKKNLHQNKIWYWIGDDFTSELLSHLSRLTNFSSDGFLNSKLGCGPKVTTNNVYIYDRNDHVSKQSIIQYHGPWAS